MAAALVGGSFLSASLQVLFDRMASRQVLDFFRGQKLNQGLLENLNILMNSVDGVIEDAEEKQINRTTVKRWLDDLKHAVFEAEDLLDEISYEALRAEMESPSTSHSQLQRSFSSLNPFEKGIQAISGSGDFVELLEAIINKLEYLVKQKDALGLTEGVGEKTAASQKIPSTSLVDESAIYGRDGDKEAAMKLLFSDGQNSCSFGVVSIVGMGGVGKTTLAQLLYNDTKVCERFDLKAWVCVSEEFDILKVTQDILEELNRKPCDSANLNQLQLELKEIVVGKNLLLVLDDVWTAEYSDLDILLTPLKFGAKGSKVIVTTRNVSVASVMSTSSSHYHLQELANEYCWLLFSKHAFGDGNLIERTRLKEVGMEIVRKCRGLPLALKALGSLLRSKRNTLEWEKISKSDIWDLENDKILPALRLSYHYLPSHLKRCFAYSAIFPKDYEFKKEDLVLLWMAEGFAEAEDVGSEYFGDLVSRSFFQRSNCDPLCFVMHDLINDLAKFESGEFFFWLEGDTSTKGSKRARHVSYTRRLLDSCKKFKPLNEALHLRTFIHIDAVEWWGSHIDPEVTNDILPKLVRLRVLSLSHYSSIIQLPDSIGKLIHLRYLDLSKTSIRQLPVTVCSLYNLQTLKLAYCVYLHNLPANFERLVNLCHLDISWTTLQEMPSHMGKLRKLQKLTDFMVGSSSGSSIKELKELQHLQGKLRIWNLQNVRDSLLVSEADMKGKKQLHKLELRWDGNADDSQHERHILELLQPHTGLESLSISGYGGTRFPTWVGDSSFGILASLKLDGCKYCSSLPPLGQLVCLQKLSITDFHSIVIVGPEFYGTCPLGKIPFGSLRSLKFERMLEWQEWIPNTAEYSNRAFPMLKEFCISECSNLKKTLPDCLPSLEKLEIKECHQLLSPFPRAEAIRKMVFEDHSRRLVLSELPSGFRLQADARFSSVDSLLEEATQAYDLRAKLVEVEIKDYYSLRCFSLHAFPNLKKLDLARCRNLEAISYPGGTPVSSLTELHLCNCQNLKLLPDHMNSLFPVLVKLRLHECPKLEPFRGNLPFKLESIEISCCDLLVSGRSQWKLSALSSLAYFSIDRCKDAESFPEENLLPASVTTLKMKNFSNLKCLYCDGLEQLTSLRELTIWKCPNLLSMPEKGLLASISSLVIWDCPLLAERCKREGDYWSKISHIRHIEIDSDIISHNSQNSVRSY